MPLFSKPEHREGAEALFGTIITQPDTLRPEEKERYQAAYCGLCAALDQTFGSVGCASLTFDMTFVDILLSALYELPETQGQRRCVPHPVKKHPYFITPATAYAADMNLFLAYYQCLDDWQDEHSRTARERARQMERFLPDIRLRNPRPCAAVEDCLARLGEMERANELNPDLPTNCFGDLMAEVLCWREDEHADTLRRMGAALGRFVYLLDAVNDLKSDIRHERYNPLVGQLDTDFLPVLTLMMAECTQAFETLPLRRDAGILRNVLYAGVWLSYRRRGGEEEAEDA